MQRQKMFSLTLSPETSGPVHSLLHRRVSFWLHAATMLAVFAAQSQAPALEFQLDFNDAISSRPAFDPDGSKLTAIMEEAAARWADAVVNDATIRISFRYDDIPTADAAVTKANNFNTRTEIGVVRFSDTQPWWFDPTPGTDTEFDLIQTLYRDLPTSQQQAGFSGSSPQPLLEVGMRGPATLVAAQDKVDALSVAFHEIGHLMGVTNQLNQANTETNDGDYDLQPLKIGGADMGVRVHSGGIFHFADPLPVMSGVGSPLGTRYLLTATDFLSAATVSGWQLDLPRVEFLGPNNGDFHVANDWIGQRVPNGDNDAYVRHGGIMQLSQNATTRDLIVDDESSIVTNGHILRTFGDTFVGLDVDGVISVQNFTGSGGVPELDTQDLVIGNDGKVQVVNETSLLDVHGDLTINVGGHLLGAGTVEVDGALNNNGTITGGSFLGFGSGGTLTLNVSPVGGRLDLDGTSDAGRVNALEGGSIRVNGQLLDPFDGVMRIGAGKSVDFADVFELGATGKVELLGGDESASLASAKEIMLGGNIVVDQKAVVAAPIQTNGTAMVNIPDADDRLDLTRMTRLGGGTFDGQGTLRQLADLHVFGDTTVSTAVYDWDGDNRSKTTITSDGVLTINSQRITTSGDTGHDGLITLRGGVLNVNTPGGWRLENTMKLHAGSTVNGTEIELAPGALIQTVQLFPFQNTEISAPVRLGLKAAIDARGEKLLLGGRTTFDGGTLIGQRTVTQAGDVVVQSDSSVDLDVYVWDGGRQDHSTTIKKGATWTLNARKIANFVFPFVDGYDGSIDVENGGALHVDLTNDSSWRLDGRLSVAGPSALTGDDLLNRGRIEGVGSIDTNVVNNGVVAPGNSTGRLAISGDYQQAANGTLEIELGGIVPELDFDVLAPLSASIDGTVSIELVEGFLPAPGTRFNFLTAFQSLTGDFSDLELIAPPGILFDGSIVTPFPTARAFEVNYAVHAADYDQDTDVDRDDLLAWQANFGMQCGADHASGDSNGDGAVNGTDFLTWQRQFNAGNAPAGALSAAQAIPEPSSALLVVLLGASYALRPIRRLRPAIYPDVSN